jgi:hypothetical protein
MVGFPDLLNGGVRCSMSYFTLLPMKEGEAVEARQFYEYSGTFIAPLDSATLSMTVGYGQHVWVDYIKLDILHDGSPREYECTKNVSLVPETPCIFPFEVYGNVMPFCSNSMYFSEGWGWCTISVKENGLTCVNDCVVQHVDWQSCNQCTDSAAEESVVSVPNCETDPRTTMEGELCVFPFVHNGKTYTDCTTDPYETWVNGFYPPTRSWCGIDGDAYKVGECAPCGNFQVSTSELKGNIT